jgi:hypothetical protein
MTLVKSLYSSDPDVIRNLQGVKENQDNQNNAEVSLLILKNV